jgi:hypothetical protein
MRKDIETRRHNDYLRSCEGSERKANKYVKTQEKKEDSDVSEYHNFLEIIMVSCHISDSILHCTVAG